MTSLVIFALVAIASTFLVGAGFNTQQYAQASANTDSQVQFAVERITENIRAANAVSITGNSITITSPPSPLISNATFTINYFLVGNNLMESYVNNSTSATYSSDVIVNNVTTFSVATLVANTKAFQITINAGTSPIIQRTFDAFGRNL
jgi:hypothetical protein